MTTVSSDWTLDHIGHAVRELDRGVEFYRSTFGFQVECRETLTAQAVDICFLSLANTLLELIAPLPGNTTLAKFLEKRGEGLHHVCYRVASVNAELKRLEAAGMTLIDREARVGSRDLYMGFVHPASCHGVLIELCSKLP